ncbi:hypothetical protein Tco_0632549 [Tanacetum coccineum]
MSVENVTSGLVPQGQKASDYDNSDPLPQEPNVCSIYSRKEPIRLQQGVQEIDPDMENVALTITSSVRQLKSLGTSSTNQFGKRLCSGRRVLILKESFAPVARFGSSSDFPLPTPAHKSFPSIRLGRENGLSYGPLKESFVWIKEKLQEPRYDELTKLPDVQKALLKSHKVVRLGINPMIQPEPEDLPKDNPKLEIAVLSRYYIDKNTGKLRIVISEAYMTFHAYATSEKTPKPKSKKKKVDSESSPKTKLTQASKGKRIKTVAKGDKPAKKKQSVTKSKGLTVLSEVALTEAEQIKLATKRSLIQTHNSHASGSGADEGTGSIPGVPNVPTYKSDDEQISWKSSEEEDDDDVHVSKDNDDDADNDDDVNKDDEDDDADNQDDEIPDDANKDDDDEQTDSDNDGDEFVHPKLSTLDDEQDKMKKKVMKKVMMKVMKTMMKKFKGRDTVMTDAPLPNVQGTQVTEDTHVIITALINPEGQQHSSSVSSGFMFRSPLLLSHLFLSVTTLPPTPLITHLQQTQVPTPANVPSSSLQDLPNFGSLFGFDHKLKTLETDFSEFKQTNQFDEAVSSIPGIVDAYLANKMHEAVKTAIQLQSERLKDEARAENADFLNKLDDND